MLREVVPIPQDARTGCRLVRAGVIAKQRGGRVPDP